MWSPPAIQPVYIPGDEAEQRAAVVREARSWIMTPYRQLGARRGVGVDCAMLLVRAWVDAGVFEEFDPRPYPPDWHLHRSEERYLAWMQTLGTEVESPQPGDIVVYKFGRCYSHSGIVSRPGMLVHSYARLDYCLETGLRDGDLNHRPTKFFDLWEKHRWPAS